jgi:ABC-type polar amino acid transport system ATPase subunit
VINLKKLVKKYNNHIILKDINLTFNKGEIVGIIGPSGGGKSSLLRCIAGIEPWQGGEIILEKSVKIGMVFQQFNLFNNLSVIENLCYPQEKVLKISPQKAAGYAIQILKKVKMMEYFNRYPEELSGGQKQRVAIARTLCMKPSIILFDEPTSALDPENVSEVLEAIRELSSPELLILIASHEIRFIQSLANRMIFMEAGEIIADENKKDFFYKQSDKRIATFLQSILSH